MKTVFIVLGIILLSAAAFTVLKGFRTHNPMKKVQGLFIAFFGVLFLVLSGLFSGGEGKDMNKYMSRLEYVQGYALGNFVREKYAGKTVSAVIRSDVTPEEEAGQKEIIRGFEASWGSPVQINIMKIAPRFVGDPTPEAPNTSNLQEWKKSLSGASFNEALSNAGSDIVLDFAGLPVAAAEQQKVDVLNTGSPLLIFPAGIVENCSILLEPLRRGTVAAIVLERLDAGKLSAIPRSEQEAFNARFVLVTAGNVDELAKSEDYKYILNDPDLLQNAEEEAEPREE